MASQVVAQNSTKLNLSTTGEQRAELGLYRQLADGSFMKQTSTRVGDWGYANTTTAATVTLATGAGQLGTMFVLGGTLGTIVVYDGLDNTGAVMIPSFTPATLAGGGPGIYTFDMSFKTGLTVVTGSNTVLAFQIRQ